MASIKSSFQEIFFTYKDVKEANPGWIDQMIEDYLATKRDIASVADETDEVIAVVSTLTADRSLSLITQIQQQIGSGDVLTCDDDGFTCDATVFTCDQDEA